MFWRRADDRPQTQVSPPSAHPGAIWRSSVTHRLFLRSPVGWGPAEGLPAPFGTFS